MGHRLLSSKMYWKKSYLNREIGWKTAVDLEDRAGACRSIGERTTIEFLGVDVLDGTPVLDLKMQKEMED